MCQSEVDMWRGKNETLEYPRFIGHEVTGTVAAVGSDVTGLEEGERVAVYSERGGYAEYTSVPAGWAVKLAEDTRADHALGEPIACAVNAVRKSDPKLNDTVCMVGCGFMGMIMLQVFRARGAGTVIAVDRRRDVLRLAATLGADHTLLADDSRDVIEKIREVTGGRGVDIGVEAAGVQGTLDLASQVVRMEGKLVVFGFHQGGLRSVDWGYWNWMAFDIVNGHVRDSDVYVDGMRIGIGLLERGVLNMSPLVTHRFRLDEINDAFGAASEKAGGFIKGVISF